MKTFNIRIEAENIEAVIEALEEVRALIEDGMTSGFDSNETSNFSFESNGDYEG